MKHGSSHGIAVAALLLLSTFGRTAASTLHVPGDFPAIRPAVEAAAEGDVILVAPGVWSGGNNRLIDLGSKNLTIQSTAGAASTILDCARLGPAFVIEGGQTSRTKIDGFTIRGGNPAGIRIGDSSPTIANCVLQGCSSSGLVCENSPATISTCVFKESGRGITLVASDAAITGCAISNNGVNTEQGGGVSCETSAAVFTACSILSNDAAARGGGIYCAGAPSPTFYVCSIGGNRAQRGSGVYTASGSPRFELCAIAGNRGAIEGGGIYGAVSSPEIVATTITRNDASTGAGIYLAGATVSMTRTILWGNCGRTTQGKDSYIGPASSLTVSCCAIDPTGAVGPGNIVYDGEQVLTDPHLCDIGPCELEPTIQGNFYLAFDSPCVAGPCGQQIGAFEAICNETPILVTTWGRVRFAYR